MGILNSKPNVQEQLTLLRQMSNEDFQHALAQLSVLCKSKCKMVVSKWDLLMIMRMNALQVKSIINLVNTNSDDSKVNIHCLLMSLILCTPHLQKPQKIQEIIQLLSFEREPGQVQKEDMEYIINVVYTQIENITDLKLNQTPTQDTIIKELYTNSAEQTEMEKIVAYLDKSEEVGKLVQLFENNQAANLDIEDNYVRASSRQSILRNPKINKMASDNDSIAQFSSQLDAKASQKNLMTDQDVGALGTEVGLGMDGIKSGGEIIMRAGGQNADATTIDMLYSFDTLKVNFNEDTISKMNLKLKQLKAKSRDNLAVEEDSNIHGLLQQLQDFEKHHIEVYGQRQVTQIMNSLFLEQRLIENDYSIIETSKEVQKVPYYKEEVTDRQSIDHGKYTEDVGQESQHHLTFREVEVVNEAKVNTQAQSLFKDFNKQYQSEMKLALVKYQYRMIYFLSIKCNKRQLEFKKFKYLGEIAGLSFIVNDVIEMDNKLSSDYIFQLIYEAYTKLSQSGSNKELLIKLMQVKYFKRTSKSWESYWKGIISKAKQTLEIQCFKEINYFKDVQEFATRNLQNTIMRSKELAVEYDQTKKIALEYFYSFGHLKAMHLVAKTYKQSKEKLLSDIKARMKKVKDKMEAVDVKLIKYIYHYTQKQRNSSLYYKTLGQRMISKCAQKGLDYSLVVEYMLIDIFKINTWKTILYVSNKQPTTGLNIVEPNIERVYASLLKFKRLKQADEQLIQESKNDGVVEFDRFKSMIIKFADDEEKLANMYGNSKQNSIQGSQHHDDKKQIIQSNSNNSQLQPIIERKVTQKHGSFLQLGLRSKTGSKGHLYNQEAFLVLSNLIEQEYIACGMQQKTHNLQQFLNSSIKDLSLEFNIQAGDFRAEIDQISYMINSFIDIEQAPMVEETVQKDDTILSQMKSLGSSIQMPRVQPESFGNDNDEKKQNAHALCENFLRNLASYKASRFQKSFKEARMQVLDEFIAALKSINSNGMMNCFKIERLKLPFDIAIEQNYWCIVGLSHYIKELEKEAQWKDLTGKYENNIGENGQSFDKVDELTVGADQDLSQPNIPPPSHIEHPKEYQQFSNLFGLMKGSQKYKYKIKEFLLRIIGKTSEYLLMQSQQHHFVIEQILEQEGLHDQIRKLEIHLSDEIFNVTEENDIQVSFESFQAEKVTLFDRKKLKSMEQIVQGAVQYLQLLEEGQDKSEFVEKLEKGLHNLQDSFHNDTKNLKINNTLTQYKEKGDLLLRKLYQYEKLIKLQRQVKRLAKSTPFIQFIQKRKQLYEYKIGKFEKILQFIKGNYNEESDDILTQQMGARLINGILSGKYLDDKDIFPQLSAQGIELTVDQRVSTHVFNFANKLTFYDEKMSTMQIQRNDFIFGALQIIQMKTIIGRDILSLKEQQQEGLNHLVNIFDIYKTPISHYQKNYERVCKSLKKDLINRIIDSDESHIKFQIFDVISTKGSALFKYIYNKVDAIFSKIDLNDTNKLDLDKTKNKLKRDLELKLKTFKEFIDLEENKKVVQNKQQQINHSNFRLLQEISALMMLVRIFYLKQEQEDVPLPILVSGGGSSQFVDKTQQSIN